MSRQWRIRKPWRGEEVTDWPERMRVWSGPEIVEGEELELVELAALQAVEARGEAVRVIEWDDGHGGKVWKPADGRTWKQTLEETRAAAIERRKEAQVARERAEKAEKQLAELREAAATALTALTPRDHRGVKLAPAAGTAINVLRAALTTQPDYGTEEKPPCETCDGKGTVPRGVGVLVMHCPDCGEKPVESGEGLRLIQELALFVVEAFNEAFPEDGSRGLDWDSSMLGTAIDVAAIFARDENLRHVAPMLPDPGICDYADRFRAALPSEPVETRVAEEPETTGRCEGCEEKFGCYHRRECEHGKARGGHTFVEPGDCGRADPPLG